MGTRRSLRNITYHGRTGRPDIHITKNLKRAYIMVRKKGGGVKRLYLDTKHASRNITSGLSSIKEDAKRLMSRAK